MNLTQDQFDNNKTYAITYNSLNNKWINEISITLNKGYIHCYGSNYMDG